MPGELDNLLASWRNNPGPPETVALCGQLAAIGEETPDAEEFAQFHALVVEVGQFAMANHGERADVLTAAGRMYLAADELSPAQSILVKAATLAPEDPQAVRLLGEVLLRRGDARNALKAFDKAVERGATDPMTRAWRERARIGAEKLDQHGIGVVAGDREEAIYLTPVAPAPEAVVPTQPGNTRLRKPTLVGMGAVSAAATAAGGTAHGSDAQTAFDLDRAAAASEVPDLPATSALARAIAEADPGRATVAFSAPRPAIPRRPTLVGVGAGAGSAERGAPSGAVSGEQSGGSRPAVRPPPAPSSNPGGEGENHAGGAPATAPPGSRRKPTLVGMALRADASDSADAGPPAEASLEPRKPRKSTLVGLPATRPSPSQYDAFTSRAGHAHPPTGGAAPEGDDPRTDAPRHTATASESPGRYRGTGDAVPLAEVPIPPGIGRAATLAFGQGSGRPRSPSPAPRAASPTAPPRASSSRPGAQPALVLPSPARPGSSRPPGAPPPQEAATGEPAPNIETAAGEVALREAAPREGSDRPPARAAGTRNATAPPVGWTREEEAAVEELLGLLDGSALASAAAAPAAGKEAGSGAPKRPAHDEHALLEAIRSQARAEAREERTRASQAAPRDDAVRPPSAAPATAARPQSAPEAEELDWGTGERAAHLASAAPGESAKPPAPAQPTPLLGAAELLREATGRAQEREAPHREAAEPPVAANAPPDAYDIESEPTKPAFYLGVSDVEALLLGSEGAAELRQDDPKDEERTRRAFYADIPGRAELEAELKGGAAPAPASAATAAEGKRASKAPPTPAAQAPARVEPKPPAAAPTKVESKPPPAAATAELDAKVESKPPAAATAELESKPPAVATATLEPKPPAPGSEPAGREAAALQGEAAETKVQPPPEASAEPGGAVASQIARPSPPRATPPAGGARRRLAAMLVAFAVIVPAALVARSFYIRSVNAESVRAAQEVARVAEANLRRGARDSLGEAEAALAKAKDLAPTDHQVLLVELHIRATAALEGRDPDASALEGALRRAVDARAPETGLTFARLIAWAASKEAPPPDEILSKHDEDEGRAKDGWYQLAAGALLESRGDPRSIERYERAANADPELAAAHVRFTRAALVLGSPAQGMAASRDFARRFPHRPETRIIQAYATAIEAGASPAAPRPALSGVVVDELPRPVRALARVLAAPDDATFAAAVDEADSPGVAVLCGRRALAAGDLAAARRGAERALAFAPSYGPGSTLLVEVLLRSGKVDEANRAAASLPAAVGLETRATVAYEMGDLARLRELARGQSKGFVVAAMERLSSPRPMTAERVAALDAAASGWFELLQVDAALDRGDLPLSREVIGAWPDAAKNPLRALRLARLLRYQGKLAEARPVLQAALPTRPARIEAALLAAQSQKDIDKALSALDDATEPERPFLRAYGLARQRKGEDAKAVIRKMKAPDEGAPLMLRSAAALAFAATQDTARGKSAKALAKAWPKNPDAVRAAMALGFLPADALKKVQKQ